MKIKKNTLKKYILCLMVLVFTFAFSSNAFAVKIKDGAYSVDFSCSGGSGRGGISAVSVVSDGGKMQLHITMSSEHYTKAVVEGKTYNNVGGSPSSFYVPISDLDDTYVVKATTVAMSQPHDITYLVSLDLSSLPDDAVSGSANTTQNQQPSSAAQSQAAPQSFAAQTQSSAAVTQSSVAAPQSSVATTQSSAAVTRSSAATQSSAAAQSSTAISSSSAASTTAASSTAASSTAASSTAAAQNQDGGINPILFVLIGVVVIVAIVAGVMVTRKKG